MQRRNALQTAPNGPPGARDFVVDAARNRLFLIFPDGNNRIMQYSAVTNTFSHLYTTRDFQLQQIRSYVYDARRDRFIVSLSAGPTFGSRPSIKMLARDGNGIY